MEKEENLNPNQRGKDMSKLLSNTLGNILSIMGVVLTETQLDTIEHITAIVCMVVGLLITITSSILIPLYRWYKKSKEDGKITEEEIQEGVKIIVDGSKEVKDKVDRKDK